MEEKMEDRPLVSASGASGHLDYLVDLASGAGNAGEAKYSQMQFLKWKVLYWAKKQNLIWLLEFGLSQNGS